MADKPTFPPTQRIGILVFDGFEPIDVFGFAEAFRSRASSARNMPDSPPYPFETVLIAKQVAKVKSVNGPSVMPDWDFAQALEEPLDVLMVPGGIGNPAAGRWQSRRSRQAHGVDARHGRESAHHGVGLHRCRRPREVRLPGRHARGDQPRRIRLDGRVRPAGAVGQRRAMGRCRQIRLLRRGLGRHRSRLLPGIATGRPGGRRNRSEGSRIRLAPRPEPADLLSAASQRALFGADNPGHNGSP